MSDIGAAPISKAMQRRFLTFRVDERLYALPAEQVSEVILTPTVARLPQAPKSLLGLANLRGAVLPVATARGLLGKTERGPTVSDRTIVLDGGAPAALAVDAIGGLVSVDIARIEMRQAELAAEPGEILSGAFQASSSTGVAKILDVRQLIDAAFRQRERPERGSRALATAVTADESQATDDREQLVTFEVAGQEFGLALESVQEILPAPETTTIVPRSEDLVRGVMAYRDTLLPLLSLRGLLGFSTTAPAAAREKVLVTTVGGVFVGLVADRARAILAVEADLVDPTPPMLAARTGGEARVKAIYRGEGGRRLVSILAPDELFREDAMRRLGEMRVAETEAAPAQVNGAERQFLVFRLGEDEFGLPIETVDEVARVPDRISRVPKTPKFLEGVINLRGEVLPVVDQRRRFDMPAFTRPALRRLVVLRTERYRAGVIVDGVSEVLRCSVDDIDEAPDLAGEATRLVNGVVNLTSASRLVLLLDPAELLTRTERGLLDAFKPVGGKAGL